MLQQAKPNATGGNIPEMQTSRAICCGQGGPIRAECDGRDPVAVLGQAVLFLPLTG